MTAPASAREAVAGRPGRIRALAAPGRRDERGGAVSLWVVLMVPVSAFAAVVALAGPQRLAAESSVQEAADDLAAFTVAWRDGHNMHEGPLPAFPPECAARSEEQSTALSELRTDIPALNAALGPGDPAFDLQEEKLRRLFEDFNIEYPATPASDKDALLARLKKPGSSEPDGLIDRLDKWDEACEALFEALVRDLGYLGIDMGSVRGFYSDSLTESPLVERCSNRRYWTQVDCTDAGETWTNAQFFVPCRTSQGRVVRDAAHVAVAGDWQNAGWAAAQVWPDGLPMAAESMGRLSRHDSSSQTNDCAQQLVVLDAQGRPVWADGSPGSPSRTLAQSVRRTALSG